MRLKSHLVAGLALAGAIASGLRTAAAETKARLDNPVSLVLKDKGWLQQDLAAKGVSVEWVLSQGSNKALEFLNARSIDFGSTAGAAALLGRANGNPIKAVYIYSRPEWTALVTTEKSPITKVTDLKGKKIAVTRGTDPHIFLLRALALNGLTERDVKIVPLRHPEGRLALSRGDVDGWSGLDPFMKCAAVLPRPGAQHLRFSERARGLRGRASRTRRSYPGKLRARAPVGIGEPGRAFPHPVGGLEGLARGCGAPASNTHRPV
jgi:sulfonate transport system substrate-binding protein